MEKKNDKTNNKTAWNLIKFGGAMCLLSTALMACGKASTSTKAYVAPKTVSLCEHTQEMLIQNDEEKLMNHIISAHLSKEGAYNIKYSFVKDDKRVHITSPIEETKIVDGVEKTILLAPAGYTLQTDETGQTYAMKVTSNETITDIVDPIQEVTIVGGEEKTEYIAPVGYTLEVDETGKTIAKKVTNDGTITDIVEPIKSTKIVGREEKIEYIAPAGYTLEVDETGKTIAKKVTIIEPDNKIYLSYNTSEKHTELYYDPSTQKWVEDFTFYFITDEEYKKMLSR